MDADGGLMKRVHEARSAELFSARALRSIKCTSLADLLQLAFSFPFHLATQSFYYMD